MAGTITSYSGGTQIWNVNDNMIDTANLVALETQVLEAKKTPLTRIQTRLKNEQTVYNAFKEDLNSFVTFMKDMSKFTGSGKATSVSQTGFVSATASATAISGTYEVSVSQLASRHQLAGKTGVNLDAAISTADTKIQINGQDITIKANTTYKQFIDQVNANSSKYGATMYTVGGSLFMASTQTGTAGKITLADDGTAASQGILANLALNTEMSPALDAKYKVNGVEQTSASNTVENIVPGLTLQLEKVTETKSTDALGNEVIAANPVKVTVDNSTATEAIAKIKEMVTAFNSAADVLANYTAEGTNMQGSNIALVTGRALSSISMFEQNGNRLYQYGIEVDKTGQLSIDATKLEAAFQKDPEAAKSFFFSSTTGLAKKMDTELSKIFGETGTLTTTLKSLSEELTDISDKLSDIDAANAVRQEAIVKKYAMFEMQMSALSSQLTYIKALTGSDDDDD